MLITKLQPPSRRKKKVPLVQVLLPKTKFKVCRHTANSITVQFQTFDVFMQTYTCSNFRNLFTNNKHKNGMHSSSTYKSQIFLTIHHD